MIILSNFNIHFHSLKILTGSDLSIRKLPMIWAESPDSGPVVWLTACGHGDEVTGIVIVHELFRLIKKHGLRRGSVYSFPIMNPIGFENISRQITFSNEDLNRSFPGNPNGTLAERIADKIMLTILEKKPSLLIDLHNDWIQSIPYTLIDPIEGMNDLFEITAEYSKQTGFACVLDKDLLRRSLSYNILKKGIPSLTLELGESYVVNEKNVQYGLHALLNLLFHLEMISLTSDSFSYPLPDKVRGELLSYSDKPLCSSSGIVRFLVKPGAIVRKGQKLAKIYNAYGRLQETLYAVSHGLVLGNSETSVAYPGASVVSFGMIT